MVAALDSISEWVIPYDILQSVGSAPEEDSLLGVLDVLRSILPNQDLDPETTSKRPEQPEIVLLPMQFLVSRLSRILSRQSRILDAQKVSERIRPEFHWQTSANQHRPDCLIHCLVSAFDEPILMMCSSTCDSYFVTKLLFEQIPNCF